MKLFSSLMGILFILFSGFQIVGQEILNIVREEITIPVSGNAHLGAILYRPDAPGTYPAIVYRTPYGIDDYDSYAELPRKAAHKGYLVFLVDVRGRYRSEGEFEAYRNEKQDGYDVIHWIGEYTHCNGKVGSYGGSYPGIVQWQAMSMKPGALVAAAPEMTPISSHHFFYYGGAFSMPWLDWFVPYIFPDKRKRAKDKSGTWDDTEGDKEWRASDRRFWYQYRPLSEIPILKLYAPEFFEWLNHPDSTGWWDFVNMETGFSDFVVPVFLLSGWYDSVYGVEGAWRAYSKIHNPEVPIAVRKYSKLILGPWNHTSITTRKTQFGEIDFGVSAGLNYDALLMDWYDQVLKDKVQTSGLAPVNIFVMGANKWRSFTNWPIQNIQEENWYLSHNQELVNALEPDQNQIEYVFNPSDPVWDISYEKSYPYDQRNNESRTDVITYTSDILDSDLEIIGEVKANLFVSSSAPDTDFSFTLSDVFPDGSSINLFGLDAGYLRMRYREGFESQQLMNPGEIYEITIGNTYTANQFKKGHRIRISITSSKAPHFDPNPNTGREIASETELKSCVNVIYSGGNTPSKLILPIYREK